MGPMLFIDLSQLQTEMDSPEVFSKFLKLTLSISMKCKRMRAHSFSGLHFMLVVFYNDPGAAFLVYG